MHHVAEHPEEEIRAIELYTLLGREGVQVRLNSLSVKAISRWEQALPLPPDFTGTPFDFLTDAEREERHLLLIGQMLCIDVKWFTEFGHLNRGDMLTSEQHRCHNEKKKFQRRV
ncbi:hypothetical protein [Klebsiella pneumoniae]|uniref:hypothetical protein n=1 Tax=Klebsiella pneumoniae TaxID=573 RepID=UPI0020A0F0BB|nr:hypothetical protein [Klebsiella pneumoniae]MCP0964162.1 hypothetical protein [Klebsiella pneumoniae]